MSEALAPAAAEPVVVADGKADVVLPALIVDAGPDAVARFLEFFAARIANGAVSRVVRGARPRPRVRVPAPRGCLHPYSPAGSSSARSSP